VLCLRNNNRIYYLLFLALTYASTSVHSSGVDDAVQYQPLSYLDCWDRPVNILEPRNENEPIDADEGFFENKKQGIILHRVTLTWKAQDRDGTNKRVRRVGVGRTVRGASQAAQLQCNKYSGCKGHWPAMAESRMICTRCAKVSIGAFDYISGHKNRFCIARGFDGVTQGRYCFIGEEAQCALIR
jgi:hypothetical protein